MKIEYFLSKIQVSYPMQKTMFRYDLHKLIWQAFSGFEPGSPQPFLFSLTGEGDENGICCLVQSATRPDWRRLTKKSELPEVGVTKVHGTKAVRFAASQGDKFHFRLQASPVKNVFLGTNRRGRKVRVKKAEEIDKWFLKRCGRHGFRPTKYSFGHQEVQVRRRTGDESKFLPLTSSFFEGELYVTEPKLFYETLVLGIGPKKIFGFGMLAIFEE